MTDPISDFLTRLRNASSARKAECSVQHSKLKASLAEILKAEGFIADFSESTDERGHKILVVKLKYREGEPAINGIKRASKPGLRRYYSSDEIPRVLGGLGVGILTTSRGVMKDRDARRNNVGGELICTVW